MPHRGVKNATHAVGPEFSSDALGMAVVVGIDDARVGLACLTQVGHLALGLAVFAFFSRKYATLRKKSITAITLVLAGALIIFWVLVFLGFGPTYYFRLFASDAAITPIVHLHSIVFSTWMLLFLAQTILVEKGRTDLHIKLGMVGLILALAIIVIVRVGTARCRVDNWRRKSVTDELGRLSTRERILQITALCVGIILPSGRF